MTPIWNLFLGNIASILIGMAALTGGFRRWFRRNVTEPIERLESSVGNTQISVDSVQVLAQSAYDLALKANNRVDQHLEGGHNA